MKRREADSDGSYIPLPTPYPQASDLFSFDITELLQLVQCYYAIINNSSYIYIYMNLCVLAPTAHTLKKFSAISNFLIVSNGDRQTDRHIHLVDPESVTRQLDMKQVILKSQYTIHKKHHNHSVYSTTVNYKNRIFPHSRINHKTILKTIFLGLQIS
jgi:hypothetical protein